MKARESAASSNYQSAADDLDIQFLSSFDSECIDGFLRERD